MNYDVDWTSQIIEKKNGTSYALELETVLFIDIKHDMHAYYCRLYVLDPRSAQEVHLARERGGHPTSYRVLHLYSHTSDTESSDIII
jgi:hypothetical protein